MKYIVFCVVVVLLTSCDFGNRLPNGFPDGDQFANILTDIHLSEATISQLHINMNKQAPAYYHDVLSKYNLTEEKFDTIVSWYLSNPKLYQKVYEKVLSNLGKKQAKYQKVVKEQKDLAERIRKEREARNVWPLNKRYTINKYDTLDSRIPFSINVDTIKAKAYQISAFYQFMKGNIVKKPNIELIVMYKDSSLDTINYKIPSTYTSTKAELSVGYDKQDTIINLSGYLLKHDTNKVINAKIKEIEFEYIPYNDSILTDEKDSSALLSSTR